MVPSSKPQQTLQINRKMGNLLQIQEPENTNCTMKKHIYWTHNASLSTKNHNKPYEARISKVKLKPNETKPT